MYSKYAWSRTVRTCPGTWSRKCVSSARVFVVPGGERGAQGVGAAVRVAVQFVPLRFECFERSGKRAERTLVRRELDDPLEAELPLHLLDRLAGLIGNELGERAAEKSGRRPHPRGEGPSS